MNIFVRIPFSIENKAISHLLKSCKEYRIAFFFFFSENVKEKNKVKNSVDPTRVCQ